MSLLAFVTVLIYLGALVLLWRERSLRYLLLLFAGHLTMLLTPLWQRVYQITPSGGAGFTLLGRFDITWALLLGGGALLALPPLIFYYGLRHRWWPRHYAAVWLGYLLFVIYFLLIEGLLERGNSGLFSDTLLVEDTILPAKVVQAVLLAGVSLGMLYTLVSTRHYALEVALAPLLLCGVVAALLFLGIFASPLWVSGLLGQSGILVTAGGLVSLGLVLWGVHLLAGGLHAGRRQQLLWR
ncbi:MAG: hypothetical protein M3R24_37290 [Chloroflexota bacterium]|nr:hypothetical protein [Chloroflexota bacterium]